MTPADKLAWLFFPQIARQEAKMNRKLDILIRAHTAELEQEHMSRPTMAEETEEQPDTSRRDDEPLEQVSARTDPVAEASAGDSSVSAPVRAIAPPAAEAASAVATDVLAPTRTSKRLSSAAAGSEKSTRRASTTSGSVSVPPRRTSRTLQPARSGTSVVADENAFDESTFISAPKGESSVTGKKV